MNKEIIYTDKAPEPIGPYSQAIKLSSDKSSLIYTSGMLGIIPETGAIAEGGIVEQTCQAITNLKSLLASSGTDLSRVIKTTVYLKNMNDFAKMNEVYDEYFGKSKPARSTVEVARLPKDALVEIEVIACI